MQASPHKRRGSRERYDPPPFRALDLSAARAMTDAELMALPRPLYVAGDAHLLNGVHRVSIVGARKASPMALERAKEIARELVAAGVVVVSGLAEGIDTAAHTAAIDAGGRTVAVIGTPIERAYPVTNAALQSAIARDHLLVSEFAPRSQVFPSNFIKRNRTMALLSHASIIVEAGDTSGSLSQASEMMRLGRPLYFIEELLAPGLAWPVRFRASGARALPSTRELLERIGA